MPKISAFYGVTIAMYYGDHAPPHFHAHYGGKEALVAIETGEVVARSFPKRAAALVEEWRRLRLTELAENWDRASNHEPLLPVPPLD